MELKNVTIKSIGKLETFANDFKVVKFVVVTKEEYPQTLELQATKDKAENLLKYNKVGDVVDVSINLRGREWTSPKGEVKVFNTIEAWKVFKSDSQEKAEEVVENVFPTINQDELKVPDFDNLPF